MSDVRFKLDTRGMWRVIEEHHRTFRKGTQKLFKTAAKGLVAKAVRFTPPFRYSRNSKDAESDKVARQRGIASVEIGAMKLFTTDPGVAMQNGLPQKPSRQQVKENSALSLMRSYHKQNRNRQGRVPKTHKPTKVVTKQGLNKYLTELRKKVGYLASGWIQGAQTMQASLPTWVKKHSGPGSGVLTITETRLYFRMTNSVGFPTKDMLMKQRIPVAIRAQTKAMMRQLLFKTKKRVKL